jgi:hypothetical protein
MICALLLVIDLMSTAETPVLSMEKGERRETRVGDIRNRKGDMDRESRKTEDMNSPDINSLPSTNSPGLNSLDTNSLSTSSPGMKNRGMNNRETTDSRLTIGVMSRETIGIEERKKGVHVDPKNGPTCGNFSNTGNLNTKNSDTTSNHATTVEASHRLPETSTPQ